MYVKCVINANMVRVNIVALGVLVLVGGCLALDEPTTSFDAKTMHGLYIGYSQTLSKCVEFVYELEDEADYIPGLNNYSVLSLSLIHI